MVEWSYWLEVDSLFNRKWTSSSSIGIATCIMLLAMTTALSEVMVNQWSVVHKKSPSALSLLRVRVQKRGVETVLICFQINCWNLFLALNSTFMSNFGNFRQFLEGCAIFLMLLSRTFFDSVYTNYETLFFKKTINLINCWL